MSTNVFVFAIKIHLLYTVRTFNEAQLDKDKLILVVTVRTKPLTA